MGWTFYNSSGQRLQAFGFVAATQTEMEAGSSTTAYVTPGRTQYHPGVAKGWCQYSQSGTHSIVTSYNVTDSTDVTDGGVGISDIAWTVDFSGADYVEIGTANDARTVAVESGNQTAGVTRAITRLISNGAADDTESHIVVFGDQA